MNVFKNRSDYFKNSVTLFSGIVIAQGVQVLLFLILPRLYGPEDFGCLALLFSAVSILSVVSTSRYEFAILLPRRQNTAFNVVKVTLINSFMVNIILTLTFIIFSKPIIKLFNFQILGNWYYLLPLVVIINTFSVVFTNWFNRNKQYKLISTNKIAENAIFGGVAIVFGFLHQPLGLVLGKIIGLLSGVLIYFFKLVKTGDIAYFKKDNNKRILKSTAIRYIKFPKFTLVAGLFNTGALETPSFLINSFFGHSVLGLFGFAKQISTVPMGIITKSLGTVFNEQAAKDYAEKGNCEQVFLKTLKALAGISFVPFLIFYFLAPDFFAFTFGEKWRQAGEFASILTPMYFFQFISSPLSATFSIAEKQEVDLVFQFSLFFGVLASMYLGGKIGQIETALSLYAAVFTIYYLGLLAYSYKYAKGIAALKKSNVSSKLGTAS
ncbi:oligosaccharide flippase family protein [Solitalea koreensis]|uniref:Membrane protein involved in the export of O-antigen and teichoic acid n=1 Tax=Solitalea koreensis TaxID=543615 RepID=A0A521ANL3_9SPHI|nr:oligosaccharide flippase family protein [Solitalea koreensis]SMO36341.1 Membrane protein involved in the export of O-antigen and teichoic acid [Solitalea koreensis]